VVDRGYSLVYWASNALVSFGDDDAQRQMEDAHPLPADWDEQQAKRKAQLDERFAEMTKEVVLVVDEVDEECADHLIFWSPRATVCTRPAGFTLWGERRVQVLVKDGEPYFVLYMLNDGVLCRLAPPQVRGWPPEKNDPCSD